MDDDRLNSEVEKHEALCDPQDFSYKDLNTKEKAWETISSAVDVDASSGSLELYPETQTSETHSSHLLSSSPGDIDPYIPTQMVSTAQ